MFGSIERVGGLLWNSFGILHSEREPDCFSESCSVDCGYQQNIQQAYANVEAVDFTFPSYVVLKTAIRSQIEDENFHNMSALTTITSHLTSIMTRYLFLMNPAELLKLSLRRPWSERRLFEN